MHLFNGLSQGNERLIGHSNSLPLLCWCCCCGKRRLGERKEKKRKEKKRKREKQSKKRKGKERKGRKKKNQTELKYPQYSQNSQHLPACHSKDESRLGKNQTPTTKHKH